MKAIAYNPNKKSFIDIETGTPELGPRDLLVEVHSISVNPVDTKVRERSTPEQENKILGYDAAGVVKQIGKEVSLFAVGDAVFYAGDLTRQGTNAELHAVDERIVGKKPKSLSFADAAALPLTAITAWEILFDSFAFKEGAEKSNGNEESLLIIGGAGGVGSILVQLAKQLTNLTVVATASRPETQAWVKKMGADHIINHREPLVDQIQSLNLEPKYVASLTASDQHFDSIIELIKPRGHIAMIDDPGPLDISKMKIKALSFSWEFMFTRSMFQTADMIKQHELLTRVSTLVDNGRIVSTATENLGKITTESIKNAHALQESGRVIGKNVLEGF